jgi:MOSC domain-containing protein YiiM
MKSLSVIEHLYAGKPQPFGPRQTPSSIIKQAHHTLNVKFEGALEDEQGNKKLHGGPYMALHQFAQRSYAMLAQNFPNTLQKITTGTIGENISAPHMNETNVFIGDEYQIGSTILKVVSPRAPCSKINHRYGAPKIDLWVAKQATTGWYYSVVQEGEISVGDQIILMNRETSPISVKEIWELRQLKLPFESPQASMNLATKASQLSSLAPEWQAYMHRVTVRLAKHLD